jgi:hypothetical protein
MYKKFFIKLDEPNFIKYEKLKILVELANENSYIDILEEIEEYVHDINIGFAKFAISSAGSIAMRLSPSLNKVIDLLKDFLTKKRDYIVSESLNVLKSKQKDLT